METWEHLWEESQIHEGYTPVAVKSLRWITLIILDQLFYHVGSGILPLHLWDKILVVLGVMSVTLISWYLMIMSPIWLINVSVTGLPSGSSGHGGKGGADGGYEDSGSDTDSYTHIEEEDMEEFNSIRHRRKCSKNSSFITCRLWKGIIIQR